jgi:hypothetical protein
MLLAMPYQPGDVIADADGWIWTRGTQSSIREGLGWSFGLKYLPVPGVREPPEGHATDLAPTPPLTLLIRDGRPVNPSHER